MNILYICWYRIYWLGVLLPVGCCSPGSVQAKHATKQHLQMRMAINCKLIRTFSLCLYASINIPSKRCWSIKLRASVGRPVRNLNYGKNIGHLLKQTPKFVYAIIALDWFKLNELNNVQQQLRDGQEFENMAQHIMWKAFPWREDLNRMGGEVHQLTQTPCALANTLCLNPPWRILSPYHWNYLPKYSAQHRHLHLRARSERTCSPKRENTQHWKNTPGMEWFIQDI
jgi:hypothetical protein